MFDVDEARAHVDAAFILELMRAFLWAELRRSGERATARRLRVRRSTLRRFMEGEDPGQKLFDAAAELALDRPLPALAPESVAVAVLAQSFPPHRRVELRREFSDALQPVLQREGRSLAILP